MAALWHRVGAQAHIHACNQAELWCMASVLAQLREREQADHMFDLDVASMLRSAQAGGARGTGAEPNGNVPGNCFNEFKTRRDRG